MDIKKKSAKRQQEDATLNRILLWFGGTVALELFMLLVNRFYINYDPGTIGAVQVLGKILVGLAVLSGIGAITGCIWLIKRWKMRGKRLIPVAVMVISFALSVCCIITLQWRGGGVRLLYILIPVAAVLALVYYLYQREFFTVALISGGALLTTWMLWKAEGAPGTMEYIVCVLEGALVIAVAILARILQRNDGQLPLKEKKVRLLGKSATYPCLYITCGLGALVTLGGLILGPVAAYTAIFLTVAWIFVMAVYYTVKLM